MSNRGTALPQGEPKPVPPAHEKRDTSAGWIFGVLIFFAVCGFTMHLVLAGFLNHLEKKPAPGDAWRPHVPASLQTRSPNSPRLQVAPRMDLATFRAQEENKLHSYGWVDRSAGRVRIPIEQAMELLLQRGLPVRTNVEEQARGPSSYELMLQRAGQSGAGGQK